MAEHMPPVACKDLWKIYGERAQEALTALVHRQLDKETVRERFGCVVGVAGVTFDVAEGETFCIMGLSGSGKSTLLRHINRLIEPSRGTVYVKGVDIGSLDRKGLERLRGEALGMVFQHMALWPHRTIRDNVAFGLEVRGVGRRQRFEAAERALALVKLDGWASHYPDELSGGMQQRVGLARALVADAGILLMDEPFSALDPLIRRELQDQFVELAAKVRKTTLFITHDLEEAIRVGHRVAIMKDGVFVQVGTPEEILTKPADGYVAQFVRGVSHLHFLTAAAATDPCTADGGADVLAQTASVPPDTRLVDLLDLLARTQGPIAVAEDGRRLGTITAGSLLQAIRARVA